MTTGSKVMTETETRPAAVVSREREADHVAIPMPPVGTRLGVESALMSGRLWSTLVGHLDGQCIILGTPEAEIPVGMKAPFSTDDTLTIRFVQEGVVVGFRASVLRRLTSPAQLTVVAWPRKIQTHGLREHPRISCHLPCQGSIGEHEVQRAMVRDVSLFGCQLRVPYEDFPPEQEELSPGTPVDLAVEIPAESGGERVSHRIIGQVVAFDGQEGYAMIRVRSEEPLEPLLNFLSTFTTRLVFPTDV